MSNTIHSSKTTNRIREFLDNTKNLDWSEANRSLDKLYYEAFDLLRLEAEYYCSLRNRKKILSGVFRFFALLFGSLGILAPLAKSAGIQNWESILDYGYLMLALSGVFLTANSLYGGTSGHGRFALTQIALEKLITTRTVQWNSMKSTYDDSEKSKSELFELIVQTLEDAYDLMLKETEEWNTDKNRSLDEFANSISNSNRRP